MQSDKLPILSSVHGMTLIEAVISLAVLSMAALAAATVAQMRANSNMSVGLNGDFDSMASSILFVLSSKKLCTEALGKGITSGGAPNDQKVFNPGNIAVGKYTDFSNPMRVGSGGYGPNIVVPAVNTKIVTGLTLTQIRFNQIYSSNPPNYVANLHVEAKKAQTNGQGFLGANTLTKDFIVNISESGNLVTGCN